MTDSTTIAQNALRQINAHSKASPAPPETIVITIDSCSAMIQEWLDDKVDIEAAPFNGPGQELDEPLSARQVIIDNLSIRVAPNFEAGKVVVSQTLMNNARSGLARVYRNYRISTIPDKVVSSTLPRGQGNIRFRTHRVFAGKGATIASSDS